MTEKNIRYPETEEFINNLETRERDIYKFMRSKYDSVTNLGENYDVEKHDKEVADLAAKEFLISPKEASDIYVAVEFKIADFYKKRMK
jgi:hypothetical protein